MQKRIQFLRKYIVFVAACSLLAACTTNMQSSHDGPPAYDVDVSNIPNAVPKQERLNHFANPASYTIRGKKYYVLKKQRGFHKRGIASWYGTKFHRQKTSSGETYNMYAMTAANKTLPIPSYVQVTNLKNGRKIIVKVNDRGPFKQDRIIDLSYVAAKKLDIIRTGTGYVDVQIVEPGRSNNNGSNGSDNSNSFANNDSVDFTPDASNLHAGKSSSRLLVQVGAFSSKVNARKLRNRIASLTHRPTSVKAVYHHRHPTYKVQIGPLASNLDSKVMRKIHQLGLQTKIIQL